MSDPTTIPLPWLTPGQAAKRLDKKEATVRRLCNTGAMSHHRDGRFLRLTEQDLADYIASCARPAGSVITSSGAVVTNPLATTRPNKKRAA